MNEFLDLTSAVKSFIKDMLDRSPHFSHFLILEGSTDSKFFRNMLNNSIFNDPIGKYILNLNSDNVIYNFATEKIHQKLRKSYLNYGNKDLSRILDKYFNFNFDYKSYNFVIESINFYRKSELSSKYYLYGIIDKDFGHENVELLRENLGIYSFHDRECTLLYHYLQLFFKYNNVNVSNIVTELLNVFLMCFEQGILERSSIDYEKKFNLSDNELKAAKIFTKFYFKENQDVPLFGIDNLEIYLREGFEHYDLLFDIYKKNKERALNSKSIFEYKSILKKWLLDDKLSDNEIYSINNIFDYCNGHYLISQIILLLKNDYFIFTEEEFVNNLINKVILKDFNYLKLFNYSPLIEYKQYRIKNNLIIKLK